MAKKVKQRTLTTAEMMELREELRKADLRNRDKLVAGPLKEAIKRLDAILDDTPEEAPEEPEQESTEESTNEVLPNE